MERLVSGIAATLLSASVALAAAGAHLVPSGGAAEQLWRTAGLWQIATALGLLILGFGWRRLRARVRGLGTGLLLLGVTLFSGTLYLQALTGGPPFPGAAPIGGSALILGWLVVAAAAFLGPRGPRPR